MFAVLKRAISTPTLAVLIGCVATIYVTLNGWDLFRRTTPTGGDMAGHVWWPAYLRDNLLPAGRLSGWSMDMYGGFPAGQFYFPLPALFIVVLNVVFPYGIAFKLGAALSVLLLPIAAWSFAKHMKWRAPAPQFAAVASVWFLLFSGETAELGFNQRIAGGSVASMLVGEFSYGWALIFMLLGLGYLRTWLEERRLGFAAALCFWAVIWCHAVVTIMTAILAVIIVLWCTILKWDRRVVMRAGIVGLLAAAASAMWFLPFSLRWDTWTTAPRYDQIQNIGDYLFTPWFRWLGIAVVFALGAWIALLFDSSFRVNAAKRAAIPEAAVLAGVGALVFWIWPEGVAWNLRFLPFWYLFISIAAAVALAEGLAVAAEGIQTLRRSALFAKEHDEGDGGEEEVGSGTWVFDEEGPMYFQPDTAAPLQEEKPFHNWVLTVATGIGCLVLLASSFTVWGKQDTLNDLWSRGNWAGVETRTEYQEYRTLVQTMGELPQGWAVWEKSVENNSDSLARYGSDFALVILPFWTNGKIGSFESLYFEASASTPYLFLTTAHIARSPANLVRGLPYVSALSDFDEGVDMMRQLGVRYYLAQSSEAIQKANASPGLRLLRTVPDYDRAPPYQWNIYAIENAAMVVPLTKEPLVTSVHNRDAWMQLAARWFESPELADQAIVQSGPKEWKRINAADGAEPDNAVILAQPIPEYRPLVRDAERILDVARKHEGKPLPEVKVSKVKRDQTSISFHVDKIGVPIRVRVSAFETWEVSGAKGPYRATPNQMVVVPTSKDVRLSIERTNDEWIGIVLTVLGALGILALGIWEFRLRRKGEVGRN